VVREDIVGLVAESRQFAQTNGDAQLPRGLAEDEANEMLNVVREGFQNHPIAPQVREEF
jgi:type III secretory pathway lipoprotein EscJ